MVAAAAVTGHLADVRPLLRGARMSGSGAITPGWPWAGARKSTPIS
jgi:hypothetical protein